MRSEADGRGRACLGIGEKPDLAQDVARAKRDADLLQLHLAAFDQVERIDRLAAPKHRRAFGDIDLRAKAVHRGEVVEAPLGHRADILVQPQELRQAP